MSLQMELEEKALDLGEELRNVDAITLFVTDTSRAKAFYGDQLGLKQIHEDANSVVFKLDSVLINLLATSAADTLIAPGKVAPAGAGNRFVLTVGVKDVDALCAEFVRRGVSLLNGPMNRPWGVRTASVQDPDGHIWEIGSNLPR